MKFLKTKTVFNKNPIENKFQGHFRSIDYDWVIETAKYSSLVRSRIDSLTRDPVPREFVSSKTGAIF